MSLIEIHGRLANTALFYTAIMAAWGLWRFFRKQAVNSNYWGAAVISEVLYLVQGILGAVIYFTGLGHLDRWVHILYGIVTVLAIPAVFFYTKGNEERRSMLLYGVAYLFLIAIILRGMSTA